MIIQNEVKESCMTPSIQQPCRGFGGEGMFQLRIMHPLDDSRTVTLEANLIAIEHGKCYHEC